jgi:hypothetical protein
MTKEHRHSWPQVPDGTRARVSVAAQLPPPLAPSRTTQADTSGNPNASQSLSLAYSRQVFSSDVPARLPQTFPRRSSPCSPLLERRDCRRRQRAFATASPPHVETAVSIEQTAQQRFGFPSGQEVGLQCWLRGHSPVPSQPCGMRSQDVTLVMRTAMPSRLSLPHSHQPSKSTPTASQRTAHEPWLSVADPFGNGRHCFFIVFLRFLWRAPHARSRGALRTLALYRPRADD